MGTGSSGHRSRSGRLSRTRHHGSKESSVARRQHQASRILEVRLTFEPSRVSTACVVQAYERVVPITRRPAPRARSVRQSEDAPRTQHVGGSQQP
jgi:hypothetical protein